MNVIHDKHVNIYMKTQRSLSARLATQEKENDNWPKLAIGKRCNKWRGCGFFFLDSIWSNDMQDILHLHASHLDESEQNNGRMNVNRKLYFRVNLFIRV